MVAAPDGQQRERLFAIVRATPWLMRALEGVREVGPPGAYLAAGAVRDTLWGALTGRPLAQPAADIDVIYCDPREPDAAPAFQAELARRLPAFRWEVTNQAHVHRWYASAKGAVAPLSSVWDGLATYPETATAVAVRLNEANVLELVAPFGLEDLFALTARHNPRRASAADYNKRIAEKRWRERWPELRILPAD